MDLKPEVVAVPVSDVDRAKESMTTRGAGPSTAREPTGLRVGEDRL